MHEISIIESILEVAEEKAREADSPSITVIKLRLGEFTAIAREALEFAFEVARLGTLAEHARLEIEVVPMVLHCVVCDAGTQPTRAMSLICPGAAFRSKSSLAKNFRLNSSRSKSTTPASTAAALHEPRCKHATPTSSHNP